MKWSEKRISEFQVLRKTYDCWVWTDLQEAALLAPIWAKEYEQAFLRMSPDSVHCLSSDSVTNTSYSVLRLPQEMRKINRYMFPVHKQSPVPVKCLCQCDFLYQIGNISSQTILGHSISDLTSRSIYYHFPNISINNFGHLSPSEVSLTPYIPMKKIAPGFPMLEIIS